MLLKNKESPLAQCLKNENYKKKIKKSYRCPKFDGDAKQTLEIRVERKRNLKLGD